MRLLYDAAMRYDDGREGQLGDILHYADVVDINLFGSKTDPLLRGQVAQLPMDLGSGGSDGPSGRQALLDSVRAGLRRLAAVPQDTLRILGARLLSTRPQPQVGPVALSTWPADIQDLARPLYDLGLPVHMLPYFGPWLWEPITSETDLARCSTTAQFGTWARDAIQAAGTGRGLTRVGAHSFRRGRAAELAHGEMSAAELTRVLRHSSARSTIPYVLQSVRVAATAAAMQAATHRSASISRRGRGGHPHEGDRRGGPAASRGYPVRGRLRL